MKNAQHPQRFKASTAHFIPFVMPDGTTATTTRDKIQGWTPHHGKTAAGQQVKSLQSKVIGESLFVTKIGGGPVLSAGKDEFEVFAMQYLTGLGFTVTPPQKQA